MSRDYFISMWIRVSGECKGLVDLVRVLSSRIYNPFRIPNIGGFMGNEGTIEFVLDVGNLFSRDLSNVVVFDIPVGNDSRFILQREGFYNLVFYHISPKYGFRITRLDISKMRSSKKLHVFITWGSKEDKLYVGDMERKVGLINAASEETPTRVIQGYRGYYVIARDDCAEIRMIYIKAGSGEIVKPSAKEIFDFNIMRVKNMLESCRGDFLLETTCVQTGIVFLVISIEAYFKRRFVELEKEGKDPNIEKLLSKIFPRKYIESRKSEILEKVNARNKSVIEVLADNYINFQNLDMVKKVFNSCYGLKFGDIYRNKHNLIEKIKRLIKYRHKIIHSGHDTTILNYEDLPVEQPIFSNKELLREAVNDVIEFINTFHNSTK